MTQISRRLEQIVRKELSKNIIPVKTAEGILVGDVLITNHLNLKFLHRAQNLLYSEIHLNSIAIKMANILALRRDSIAVETLWRADQEYGKWFVDSQMLRAQHQKALHNQDYERADMLWARYSESRDRTVSAKKQAERLLQSE
jgi:hypothetical protein